MRGPLLIIAALVAAGCISPEEALPDPDDAMNTVEAFLDPILDSHDHADPAEHALKTASMHELGFNVLGDDGKPFTYIGEIDWLGDYAYIAVIGRGSLPGFVIVDVTDATNPVVVGRGEMPNAYVVDVKIDDDGKFLYAASQAGTRTGTPTGLQDALGRYGVWVWNVEDKTKPVLVSQTPVAASGCHMLSYWKHNGEHLACTGETILFFDPVDDALGTRRLTPVGQYSPQSQEGLDETTRSGETGPGPLPHDQTIQTDPVTGNPVMFVSHWDMGLRVVDLANLAAPRELGTWTGAGATHYSGNVHSAMAVVMNDTRYVVAGPELLGQGQVPSLYIMKADDYGNMELVAEWWAPGDHASQGLLLTTHQFQIVDGRIYMAYNHGGVWVLDLATIIAGGYREDPARPDVLGYHLERHAEVLDAENANPIPNTWDVVVRHGVIWATDRYTGLYALHLTGDEIGNEELSSFA